MYMVYFLQQCFNIKHSYVYYDPADLCNLYSGLRTSTELHGVQAWRLNTVCYVHVCGVESGTKDVNQKLLAWEEECHGDITCETVFQQVASIKFSNEKGMFGKVSTLSYDMKLRCVGED